MTRETGYIVSHTHWDREWRTPLCTSRIRLIEMMDQLLDRFHRDPSYRAFLLDGQYIAVEDYLEQRPEQKRLVLHLLHANTINRGGTMKLEGGTHRSESQCIEVIAELSPLPDVRVELRTQKNITAVHLQPQDRQLEYEFDNKRLRFRLDEFVGHQMIVCDYA